MRRLGFYLRLYKAYLRLGVLKLVQYPVDSIISWFSIIGREATGFLGVFAIANAVGMLGGWSIYGVTMIFAFGAMIEAISRGLMDNVWSIDSSVRRGQMDVLLIRPANVLFQLLGARMHFESLISFLVPFGLMIFSMVKMGIPFSIGMVLFFVEVIVFGTILNTSLYLIFNSINFWIVQGSEIAKLVQTFREFSKYPINIFPALLQVFFTFVIPFGFVGYYPAMYMLGKTEMCVPAVMPIVAILTAVIAGTIWCLGMKTYDSTGT